MRRVVHGGRLAAGGLEVHEGSDHESPRCATQAVSSITTPPGPGARQERVARRPAVLPFADDAPFAVLVPEVHGDRVGGAYSTTEPDEPTRLG